MTRVLKKSLVMTLFFITASFSQVPTLNPDQTVNLATGEMGFSLPLGTLVGAKGQTFPLSINYQSGIKYDQLSSAVGLGFSYDGGCISKKIVMVNDENIANDYHESKKDVWGTPEGWKAILGNIVLVFSLTVGTIVSFFCMVYGTPALGALALSVVASLAGQAANMGYSAIVADAMDFCSGGTHCPVYNNDAGQGVGFFHGGDNYDLPDIYTISTPFAAGQLIWVGTAAEGHFTFKQTGGSSKTGSQTNDVDYNKTTHVFTIKLSDGTRLIFDKACPARFYQSFYYSKLSNEVASGVGYDLLQQNSVPVRWMLTKVLFPDYVDGDGDNNPATHTELDKGSWICFHYLSIRKNYCTPLPNTVQCGPYSAVEYLTGRFTESFNPATGPVLFDITLDSITTPNQKAFFDYDEDGKKDDCYFSTGGIDWYMWKGNTGPRIEGMTTTNGTTTIPVARRLLQNVRIVSKNNELLRKVSFSTDYSLAHWSLSSYCIPWTETIPAPAENPYAGKLTLRKITGYDYSSNEKWNVSFDYVQNNPSAGPITADGTAIYSIDALKFILDEHQDREYVQVWPEMKDYWGYYCPAIDETHNDFNADGVQLRTEKSDAWSLSKVTFSSGMNIEWKYEPHRYDRVNGQIVKTDGATEVAKFGGGIRVKELTINDGLGNNYKKSFFYTNTACVFVENKTGSGKVTNSSGYASTEPYPYLLENDSRPVKTRGGLYTPAIVAYEKVQVVNNYIAPTQSQPNGIAPNGFTVYEYSHAGDPTVPGYYPNLGAYGEIDYSWKRGCLMSVSAHNKAGKTIDSTFNDYSFVSFSNEVIASHDIENHTNDGTFTLYNKGFVDYGWTKLENTVNISNGVSVKKNFVFGDVSPTSKDYVEHTVQKSSMSYSATAPTFEISSPNIYFTRTAMVNGTGSSAGKGTLFIARGLQTPYCYDDVSVQAISNVDLTSGTNPLSNVQWSNVSVFKSNICPEYVAWRLTGLDAIDYHNDGVKNDLLFQFVYGSAVKLVVWPNVQVQSNAISHETAIHLRVVANDGYDPQFIGAIDNSYLGMDYIFCSAVCNLELATGLDIVFYHSKHSDREMFFDNARVFVMQDIDLLNQTAYGNIKSVKYANSKSIYTDVTFRYPNGEYPIIGPHSCFLDLDGDGKQNDWVMNDLFKENGTDIIDVVIKNVSVNATSKTISFDPLDPALSKTTRIVTPANFNQLQPFTGEMNIFGIAIAGDLSRRIYPFFIPVGGYQARAVLLSLYPTTVAGDLDGQPNQITETNSDGSRRITVPTPAYFNYPLMGAGNKHILTTTCQTTIYSKAKDDASTDLKATDAVSSHVAAWNNNSNIWLPCSSYSWKQNISDISAHPLPLFTFTNHLVQNEAWQFTGGISRYNADSKPVETVTPVVGTTTMSSSTVYGTVAKLPIASIVNAKSDESRAFTCDYDFSPGVTGFWDPANGWVKPKAYDGTSGALLCSDPDTVHFGQKSIHIKNSIGVSCLTRFYPNKSYTISAWVKVISGTLWIDAGFCTLAGDNGGKAGMVSFNASDCQNGTIWKLVKCEIPASKMKDLGAMYDWYINTAIGFAGDVDAYVDDIRIYPVGAMVSTTYYDQLWQQPIMSVDANDNPSKRVEYDDFGRPVTTYKMNKTTTELTPLNEKEYHLMNDAVFPDPAKWYKIVSKAASSRCIDILGSQGQNNALLHMYTFANTPNQLWQFKDAGGGYYYIKTKINPSANININDPDGTKMVGTQLEVFPASTIWQMWKIAAVGDGCYRISSNARIGNVIECSATAELSPVQLGSYKAGDKQKWQIIEVP